MRLALHQPDIAGNVGAIHRLSACLGVGLEIVMPCGFPFSDRSYRRAKMDYGAPGDIIRWATFDALQADLRDKRQRLVLLTSAGDTGLYDARFRPDDLILMGSEGAGVPAGVHDAADLRLRIPMRPDYRSLNISVAAGIALAEALRQTGQLPE